MAVGPMVEIYENKNKGMKKAPVFCGDERRIEKNAKKENNVASHPDDVFVDRNALGSDDS